MECLDFPELPSHSSNYIKKFLYLFTVFGFASDPGIQNPSTMKSTSTLLVALASVFQLTTATDRSTTVDLGYSKYEGISNNNGITRWSGIRYAAAPVGNLRFRAAQDPVSTGNQVISAKTVCEIKNLLRKKC